ncbi:MAG: baseplate J/gp47 family protein [Synechococcaceae cyanobacterium]
MVRRLTRSESLPVVVGDGSTAALRQLQAPDPDRVSLGDGGTAAALRFAQAMTCQLRWMDPDNFDPSELSNNDEGDWQALCNPQAQLVGERLLNPRDAAALTPEAMADYWQHSEPERSFTAAQLRWLARPHFALLLVFLQLMRHYNQLLQAIPARHLDHYYQQRLGFQPQPAQPNQVTVCFELASEASPLFLPAGTLLRAGVDNEGRDLHYSTNHDLWLNHARLCELRALHVERQITTLASLRDQEPSAAVGLDGMLRLVYGSPHPGDSVPPLQVDGLPAQLVESQWLLTLLPLLRFFWSSLKLEIQEFQQIMRLHARRHDPSAEAEWQQIFQRLGLHKLPAREQESLRSQRHFETWFCACILGRTGQSLNWQADGISDLNGIDDLYLQGKQDEVAAYLQALLSRQSCLMEGEGIEQKLSHFADLMVLKLHIDNDWRQINWLLQRCGQRQRSQPTWLLQPDHGALASTDFSTNLKAALNGASAATLLKGALPEWGQGLSTAGPGADLAALQRLDQLLTALEAWFAMPAERLHQLAGLVQRLLVTPDGPPVQPSPGREIWPAIDAILQAAHGELQRQRQQSDLTTCRQACASGPDGVEAFEAVVQQVLRAAPADSADATSTGDAPLSWRNSRQILAPWLATGQLEQLDRFQALLVKPGSAPRSSSWQEVQTLLAGVRSRLQGWQPAPLARSEWRLLHRQRQAIEPGAGSTATPLQPCFTIPPVDPAAPPEAGPGLAVASPLLALAEGRRTITLTLALEPDGFSVEALLAALPLPPGGRRLTAEQCAGEAPKLPDRDGWGLNQALVVELSTAAGWLALPLSAACLGAPVPAGHPRGFWTLSQQQAPKQGPHWGVLQLTLTLDAVAPALAPLEPGHQPQLRLRLRPWLDGSSGRWRSCGAFEGLSLAAAHLRVRVEGIKNLTLQHEGSRLDPLEPFTPFGASPALDSSFYLSHPELLDGDHESLELQARWCKLPPSIERHYSAYLGWPGLPESSRVSADHFQAEATLLDRQSGPVLPARQLPLFDSSDAGRLRMALPSGKAERPQRDAARAGDDDDLRLQDRVWRLRLTPTDFGHGLYPALAAGKAQELALAINAQAAGQALAMADAISRTGGSIGERYQASLQSLATAAINPDDYSVPEPYTPLLAELEASYSRARMLWPGADGEGDQLLHLHPMGEETIPAEAPTLLPAFPHPGVLVLGLEGCQPPQPIALAFQLAEGSARGARQEPPLRWEVRDGDRWRPLQVEHDGTSGLLHSGIVRLVLPQLSPAQGLPAERVWVRVLLLGAVQGYATILAVQTQAVEAVGLPAEDGAAPAHAPLAPGSIQELVEMVPAITAIHQPFSSRGGEPPETAAALRLRVAEALRHKNRALAAWDYERLLWAAFASQLHKVICRPALEPSTVVVLVIPNLREQVPRNLLAPGASSDLLEAMADHLRRCCPPEVTVQVRNPLYVHVQARLWVCLREGTDPIAAQGQLQLALTRALSPWCFDAAAEVNLGGSIQLSEIAAAIDPLPFVDYVDRVGLALVDPGGLPLLHGGVVGQSLTSLAAPSADAVLIAYSQHEIVIVPAGANLDLAQVGIGRMAIQADLQVS